MAYKLLGGCAKVTATHGALAQFPGLITFPLPRGLLLKSDFLGSSSLTQRHVIFKQFCMYFQSGTATETITPARLLLKNMKYSQTNLPQDLVPFVSSSYGLLGLLDCELPQCLVSQWLSYGLQGLHG